MNLTEQLNLLLEDEYKAVKGFEGLRKMLGKKNFTSIRITKKSLDKDRFIIKLNMNNTNIFKGKQIESLLDGFFRGVKRYDNIKIEFDKFDQEYIYYITIEK